MEVTVAILAYITVGMAAGLLGGLLGIGGGVITVPCLYYIFYMLDYPREHLMHLSIGTSLAAMIFNTAASTWAHNKREMVLWDVFKKMAPGLCVGSIIGALIAEWLSGEILEIFFGVFLCALAINFWRKYPSHEEPHRLPRTFFMLLWSGGIGGISNVLGIGGGTLIVPFFTAFKMSAKKAIGTSAACSLLVTCIGAVTYLMIGMKQVDLPENVGYIDLPAFFTIGIVCLLMAPIGAKWTHQISVDRLRKIFALILIITGLSMIT